jgi:hypothetical protein
MTALFIILLAYAAILVVTAYSWLASCVRSRCYEAGDHLFDHVEFGFVAVLLLGLTWFVFFIGQVGHFGTLLIAAAQTLVFFSMVQFLRNLNRANQHRINGDTTRGASAVLSGYTREGYRCILIALLWGVGPAVAVLSALFVI